MNTNRRKRIIIKQTRTRINFIFSIGFRCYSPDFLKTYNIRNISGPFDYLFIDIETAFNNINNNFKKFMEDIIVVNKNKNSIKKYYSNQKVDQKIIDFLKYENIGYMRHNYNDTNIIINQNFIKNNHPDLYHWESICVYMHHDITIQKTYEKIKERVDIFKNIYNERNNNMCLFYITKIIETTDLKQYKKHIENLKKKYNICIYLIIIICSDKLPCSYSFENKTLYIIKKVNNYQFQYNNGIGTDNNLNYDNEFKIIDKIFDIKLCEYDEIKSIFTPPLRIS